MIRTFLRGINVSFLLLIIISTFSSCANEMNVFEGNNNRQINFSVSVPEWKNIDSLSNSKSSRATPIIDTSFGTDKSFNLIADQNDGAGNYSTLINSQAVTYTNNIWKTSNAYYWSGTANKTISFYAYYPSTISNVNHTAGSSPTLSYTVPDKVSDQIDIMTATNNNVSGNTNSSTSLTFNHIFAAVQFNIGSSGMPNGTITGIALNNILCKGTYNFNGTWTQDATTKKSFSQTVSSSTTAGTTITSGATTFMMMPQTLGSDASITVTYSNGGTLTKSISGTWTAGNIYTYNISKIKTKTFDYTGYIQTYTVPLTGTYKLEVWGAQGGNGGNGGYAFGNIYLTQGTILYCCIGGAGTFNLNGSILSNPLTAGYNGGGYGQCGGGGATHIAIANRGVLKNYLLYQAEVLLVAGGGGGDGTPVGAGGGLKGGDASVGGSGGTQNAGGSGIGNGSFGQGGNIETTNDDSAGAGGGGWYGGGSSTQPMNCSGGGGSGHLGTSLIVGTTGMQNDIQTGNGYATITFISAN